MFIKHGYFLVNLDNVLRLTVSPGSEYIYILNLVGEELSLKFNSTSERDTCYEKILKNIVTESIPIIDLDVI